MVVLMGKEFSATAVSTLDFVQNQNRSGFGTNLAKFLHKFGSRYFDTAHSLYSFDDNSAYVTFRQFLLHRFDVIQREIGHMTVVVDRSNDGGVVCSLHCKGCTSVEGFAERNDFGASVIERSQLQRVFIGFGSAVDQKQRVIFITGNLSQACSHFLLQLVDNRVGIKAKGCYLIADHLHIVGMRVSDGDDGMASVEVQIFRTVLIPYFTALSFDYIDVI